MVDQHSARQVKLTDSIEGMEFPSDARSSYLNLTTAWSPQCPWRLILGGIPCWLRSGRSLSAPYRLPRSVGLINPVVGWR